MRAPALILGLLAFGAGVMGVIESGRGHAQTAAPPRGGPVMVEL